MTAPDLGAAPRRVAVVTGGSRGIGKAIVERLATAGVEVYFTFIRNEGAARAVVDDLRARGLNAVGARVDSRDIAQCRAFVQQTIATCGRLDVLVNNAAITADRLLPTMSDEDWSAVLETTLHGAFGTTKSAATQMMRQKSGRIINLTSVSGLIGMSGQTNYCAAKAAMIGFTRALAKELAGWGVCVNAVAPGYIDTDMLAAFAPEQRAAAMARVPMRRFGSTGEVAALVAYLALECPQYLTGQTLVLDGGLTG